MSTSIQSGNANATVSPPSPPTSDIEIPNLPKCCKATTIGLSVTSDVTESQLVKAVEVIEKQEKGHQWQLGDALLEIKRRFPERSAMMMNETADRHRESHGQSSRTQAMQVASRFPDCTRVHSLSWTHHRVCAFFDTLDERVYWVHQARDHGWTVRELEKAIKEADVEPEPETDPDLYVLKDPAVRAYLERDIENQRAGIHDVPENAPFLRDLIYSRIDATKWQLARTVETDCDAVREAVTETMGTSFQVFEWLRSRMRVISPPDVRVYLGMLKDAGRITEEKDEKPNPTAKGTTATVYKPKRNAYDDKRDEEKKSALTV